MSPPGSPGSGAPPQHSGAGSSPRGRPRLYEELAGAGVSAQARPEKNLLVRAQDRWQHPVPPWLSAGGCPWLAAMWPLPEARSGDGHLLLQSQQGGEPSLTPYSSVPHEHGCRGPSPLLDPAGEKSGAGPAHAQGRTGALGPPVCAPRSGLTQAFCPHPCRHAPRPVLVRTRPSGRTPLTCTQGTGELALLPLLCDPRLATSRGSLLPHPLVAVGLDLGLRCRAPGSGLSPADPFCRLTRTPTPPTSQGDQWRFRFPHYQPITSILHGPG